MDPLTILGSTIACIQIADRAGGLLAKARQIHDAPKDFEEFVVLVTEWKTLLQSVHHAFSTLGLTASGPGISEAISLLQEAHSVILKLEKMVAYDLEQASSGVEGRYRKVRRLRWVRSRATTSALKDRLLDLRNKVTTQLVMISMFHNNTNHHELKQLIAQVVGDAVHSLQTQNPDSTITSSPEGATSLTLQESCGGNATQQPPIAQESLQRRNTSDLAEIVEPAPSSSPAQVLKSVQDSIMAAFTCKPHCLCRCHKKSRVSLTNYIPATNSSLEFSYAGLPVFSPSCDMASCKDRNKMRFDCTVKLPDWIISRALLFTVAYSDPKGPELQLRTVRIRSSKDLIFTFAVQGNVQGLRDLFQSGEASAVDVDEKHQSALLLAIDYRQVETAKFLQQQGAAAQQEDAVHRTPYDMAWNTILSPAPRTVELCERFKELFPRSDLLDVRQFSVLQMIILGLMVGNVDLAIQDPECSIDYRDADGNTALSWAAKLGRADIVKKLLAHKADAGLANITHRTPLHRATVAASASCMGPLLEAGADVDALDFQDSTPLHYAASCSYSEEDTKAYFEPLLAAGADIHAQNIPGQSALHIALERNITNNALYLLQKGADTNLRDRDGASCLAYAIKFDRTAALEVMLRQADIGSFDADHILDVARNASIATLDLIHRYHDKLQPPRPSIILALEDVLRTRVDLDEQWRSKFDGVMSHLAALEVKPNPQDLAEALR